MFLHLSLLCKCMVVHVALGCIATFSGSTLLLLQFLGAHIANFLATNVALPSLRDSSVPLEGRTICSAIANWLSWFSCCCYTIPSVTLCSLCLLHVSASSSFFVDPQKTCHQGIVASKRQVDKSSHSNVFLSTFLQCSRRILWW